MAATAPTEVSVDLMGLLVQVSRTLETELIAGLASLGISQRDYCVLSKALPGDLTQIRLANEAALDKTTMVVTLDALERAGLAERRPSPADRRARIVAVTEQGQRIVAEASEIVAGIYADVLSVLPNDERQAFMAALSRLASGRLATPAQQVRPPRRRAAARAS